MMMVADLIPINLQKMVPLEPFDFISMALALMLVKRSSYIPYYLLLRFIPSNLSLNLKLIHQKLRWVMDMWYMIRFDSSLWDTWFLSQMIDSCIFLFGSIILSVFQNQSLDLTLTLVLLIHLPLDQIKQGILKTTLTISITLLNWSTCSFLLQHKHHSPTSDG